LAQLRRVYGEPPVLSTESMDAHQEMMRGLLECFGPTDFFQVVLVRDIAEGTWEAARWARQKTLSLHRRYRDRLEFQVRQRKAAAQKKADFKKRVAESTAEQATQPEEVADHLVEEIDAILLEPATELDHNRDLEVAIVYLEKLDKLQMMALARRNKALKQFALYRESLGQRLRDASDAFIASQSIVAEAHPQEIEGIGEAPPVQPQ
jgi:hypothetical protein